MMKQILILLFVVPSVLSFCDLLTLTNSTENLEELNVTLLDNKVKEKIANAIAARVENLVPKLEASQEEFVNYCEGSLGELEYECEQCAEQECSEEPDSIQKLMIWTSRKLKQAKEALKKTGKETERIVKQARDLIKNTSKAIKKAVQKVVKKVGKHVRKVVRKVRQVVRKVGRVVRNAVRKVRRVVRNAVRKVTKPVTRVIRRVTKPVARVIRRVFRRVSWRRRRRFGKRNTDEAPPACAMECTSCQEYQTAIDSQNFYEVCGENEKGLILLNQVKGLEKALPREDVPLVKKVSRKTMINGSQLTVVKMTFEGQDRQATFKGSLFDNLQKLEDNIYYYWLNFYSNLFPIIRKVG